MIIASLCTIPPRKDGFKQVAHGILHEQTRPIDYAHIWLNGYDTIHSDLPQDPRLEYHLEPSNPGPQARYRIGESLADDATVLTLDDDLIYPTDYVEVGVRALENQGCETSICFGGVFWDWVVPTGALEYHAHKRLISYPGQLDADTPVPVLMGGAAFHRAHIFKTLMSQELPGFATNDDLMASFNLQKCGCRILSIAKPANWIRERLEQNAEHALWFRDVVTRVATFKALVCNYGFVPWSVDTQPLREASSCLVVCSGAIDDRDLAKLSSYLPANQIFHMLEIVDDGIGRLASRPLRPHQEHFVSVPASGGQFDSILPVHLWRLVRVQGVGWKMVKRYLEWLDQALYIKYLFILDIQGPSWTLARIMGWAREMQVKRQWSVRRVDV